MKISKTVILSHFMTIAGIAALFGLDWDVKAIGDAFVHLWDSGVALYGLVVGPVVHISRTFSTDTVFKGLLSRFLGIKG